MTRKLPNEVAAEAQVSPAYSESKWLTVASSGSGNGVQLTSDGVYYISTSVDCAFKVSSTQAGAEAVAQADDSHYLGAGTVRDIRIDANTGYWFCTVRIGSDDGVGSISKG